MVGSWYDMGQHSRIGGAEAIKMLATQEVRSCHWTMEGYHRQRKGSRSRHRWVHYECQSLEDVGCDQRREWAIAVGG
ncbi:hypothetical protein BHM03_00001737 [Ensete ventricosum]|nr:hypothetical protein BHM03_00001737 [Ensete ventricosum]